MKYHLDKMIGLSFFALALSTPAAASNAPEGAEPPIIAQTSPPLLDSIEFRLGVGTPTGLIGLEYQRLLSDMLAIGAGLGIGAGGDLQSSLTLRAGRLDGERTMGIGVGISRGDATNVPAESDFFDGRAKVDMTGATWLNAELFWAKHFKHMHVRLFVGFGGAVQFESCVYYTEDSYSFGGFTPGTTEGCDDKSKRLVLPSLGIGIGRSF